MSYRGRKLGDGGLLAFMCIFLVMMSLGQAIHEHNTRAGQIAEQQPTPVSDYGLPEDAGGQDVQQASWIEENRPFLGTMIFALVVLVVIVPVVRLHPPAEPHFPGMPRTRRTRT